MLSLAHLPPKLRTRHWCLALLCGLLVACQTPAPPPPSSSEPDDGVLSDPAATREALYAQFRDWQGVPYQLGGLSRQGVDCSGFVQLTFRQQFGLDLPRDTGTQVQQGVPIGEQALRPGDLLFFQTGKWQRHVGIFLHDGQFLHASTRKGVIISELDNPYWTRHYWQARRLSD